MQPFFLKTLKKNHNNSPLSHRTREMHLSRILLQMFGASFQLNVWSDKGDRFPHDGGPAWVLAEYLPSTVVHQLQGVEEPETEGRIIPFGEGLEPNQDIWKANVQVCHFEEEIETIAALHLFPNDQNVDVFLFNTDFIFQGSL